MISFSLMAIGIILIACFLAAMIALSEWIDNHAGYPWGAWFLVGVWGFLLLIAYCHFC
jgi:hypothetical protein